MNYLYYVHDPMCSWCYAFDRIISQIESQLPEDLLVLKIVGGLAPDSNTPMPTSLINSIQENWMKIEASVPQIQFNYQFWTKNQPLRSTYPSCRAVLAAKKQSVIYENKMIQQIQWAYYKNAENPSLDNTLISCAEKTGLDMDLFINDYQGSAIEKALQHDIKFARSLGVSSYPSLVLQINKQTLPLAINYNNAQMILDQINQNLI